MAAKNFALEGVTTSHMKHLIIVALLVSFLTSGCQIAGTARMQENPGLFPALNRISPKPVRDGVVGYGFSSSQVYQALGPTNREATVAAADGLLETWTYYRPPGDFVLELLEGVVVSIRGEL